ncbi:DUF4845 domain-containing protein [Candidatus Venteria ishoeyi]|uniref:DUF4845 domain-containing protein n=1 Tax=Candidatus Venteria ishoeyi TaxID=1899563 RepID=A0A1H6F2F0_9GAMM|nr:DUF4845 domain-containing protein [Candidatus Venteria ishoeyi]MDM8548210.1 DUF4845 domain-containing protein [Candidatus Venteria ishoeyi]SEH04338.1 Uncharacterised protein [Candidatus Venteria ishoeyi]
MQQTFSSRKQQQGIGFWGVSFILGVIVIVTMVALKLIPIYDEYAAILRTVEQVKDGITGTEVSKTKIRDKILNGLYPNNVRSISQDNFKEHFKIKPTGSGYDVIIQYNREAEMVSNVYLLVKFDNTISF